MQTLGTKYKLPVQKILLLEDNPDDVELIEFHFDGLKHQTLSLVHCDTLANGLRRLMEGDIEVILLDLSLPDSTGIDTVKRIRQAAPSTPIVVLTGTEDHETAIHAIENGAQDYLLKGQIDLATLCRSIGYALARQHILSVNAQLAAIVDCSDDAIIGKTISGTITSWNNAAERLFGYSAAEVTGQSVGLIIPADAPYGLNEMLASIAKGEVVHQETVRVTKSGQMVDVSETISPIRTNGSVTGAAAIEHDISARKHSERELKDTEQRLMLALKAGEVGVWDLDILNNTVWRSLRHDEIFGHSVLVPEWNFEIFITYERPPICERCLSQRN